MSLIEGGMAAKGRHGIRSRSRRPSIHNCTHKRKAETMTRSGGGFKLKALPPVTYFHQQGITSINLPQNSTTNLEVWCKCSNEPTGDILIQANYIILSLCRIIGIIGKNMKSEQRNT